jgi:hypothetical protein
VRGRRPKQSHKIPIALLTERLVCNGEGVVKDRCSDFSLSLEEQAQPAREMAWRFD